MAGVYTRRREGAQGEAFSACGQVSPVSACSERPRFQQVIAAADLALDHHCKERVAEGHVLASKLLSLQINDLGGQL
jgi:hypothetical protein